MQSVLGVDVRQRDWVDGVLLMPCGIVLGRSSSKRVHALLAWLLRQPAGCYVVSILFSGHDQHASGRHWLLGMRQRDVPGQHRREPVHAVSERTLRRAACEHRLHSLRTRYLHNRQHPLRAVCRGQVSRRIGSLGLQQLSARQLQHRWALSLHRLRCSYHRVSCSLTFARSDLSVAVRLSARRRASRARTTRSPAWTAHSALAVCNCCL